MAAHIVGGHMEIQHLDLIPPKTIQTTETNNNNNNNNNIIIKCELFNNALHECVQLEQPAHDKNDKNDISDISEKKKSKKAMMKKNVASETISSLS